MDACLGVWRSWSWGEFDELCKSVPRRTATGDLYGRTMIGMRATSALNSQHRSRQEDRFRSLTRSLQFRTWLGAASSSPNAGVSISAFGMNFPPVGVRAITPFEEACVRRKATQLPNTNRLPADATGHKRQMMNADDPWRCAPSAHQFDECRREARCIASCKGQFHRDCRTSVAQSDVLTHALASNVPGWLPIATLVR